MNVGTVSNGILAWMVLVSGFLFLCVRDDRNPTFFRVGPHPDLQIFHMPVDTTWKYAAVVVYTCGSTLVRTMQQEVVRPWVIQEIQNESPRPPHVMALSYPVIAIETMYVWFDWLLCLNVLMAQIDLMLIEMIGNVAITMYTTRLYLERKAAAERREPLLP